MYKLITIDLENPDRVSAVCSDIFIMHTFFKSQNLGIKSHTHEL